MSSCFASLAYCTCWSCSGARALRSAPFHRRTEYNYPTHALRHPQFPPPLFKMHHLLRPFWRTRTEEPQALTTPDIGLLVTQELTKAIDLCKAKVTKRKINSPLLMRHVLNRCMIQLRRNVEKVTGASGESLSCRAPLPN